MITNIVLAFDILHSCCSFHFLDIIHLITNETGFTQDIQSSLQSFAHYYIIITKMLMLALNNNCTWIVDYISCRF